MHFPGHFISGGSEIVAAFLRGGGPNCTRFCEDILTYILGAPWLCVRFQMQLLRFEIRATGIEY